MKTIISITALASLLGLISFAVAESRSPKAPKAEAAAKVAAKLPAKEAAAPSPAVKMTKPATKKVATTAPQAQAQAKAPAAPKVAAKSPLTPAQEDKLLALLNEGTADELALIPGIAETRADSIVSARPYSNVHEIIKVEGVGNATFEKILAHGKSLTQRSTDSDAGARKS